ncbi:Transcriptional activator protein ExaE [Dissostichus eleginoides]|uniref:Transcriptional activator protein ExaE n=1 Tax=Dissostichus eleginoides TaxID=100907 RepID=A0AAD9B3Q2_DISEL|nr:Transcriptional activator protein ExaE [Dissostichus eleginoides]
MSLMARPGLSWRDHEQSSSSSQKHSAAFFSSVRAKKARQVVTGIRDSQGIVVTEDGQMVRVATDHFRDSFKEKEVGRGDDFLELLERQVPGDIVQALELPLTTSVERNTYEFNLFLVGSAVWLSILSL